MSRAGTLVQNLEFDDVDWILDHGAGRRLEAGQSIIQAGEPVTSLILVLEGALGVFGSGEEEVRIAVLGPGEVVGEMSLVEDREPTESVRAVEECELLVLPHGVLRKKFESDPAFGVRFFSGMAEILSQRLRTVNSQLTAERAPEEILSKGPTPWQAASGLVEEFKSSAHELDTVARDHSGRIPPPRARAFIDEFQGFYPRLEGMLGVEAPGNPREKAEVGAYLRKEMLPFFLLTECTERMYSKPRGFPGDYLTVEMIHRNRPGGTGRIGSVLDGCFLEAPAARAVRNRPHLLEEQILETVKLREGRPARITSLVSGPAREVFGAFASLEDSSRLEATLLDFDPEALSFVARQDQFPAVESQLRLVNENLVQLALARADPDIQEQDLVYSVGLIDYFEDRLVLKILELVHGMLRAGGRVILGNFHPHNPCRAFMDHVLEWRLIHRDEGDMDRLFSESVFGRPSTEILFEAEGINLFACCRKE